MAKKKAAPKTVENFLGLKTIEEPFYISGDNVRELMSSLEKLPKDMTIVLEETKGSAVGITFDRVVTGTNQSGQQQKVALFRRVNQECLDNQKAAAAGK